MSAPEIVVGPLLRHVAGDHATVWVETSAPCRVTLRAGTHEVVEPTWGVHGHHFALLRVLDLEPGSETSYEIELDGTRVWPEDPDRPSVIRTPVEGDVVRLAFGSCRRGESQSPEALRSIGADAIVALAHRMADTPHERWPDALLLLGDQVYADIPSEDISRRLAERRAAGLGPESVRRSAGAGGDRDVSEEICDFEEYSWLYRESWSDPDVRWLLSTVPSCMILDDHDLRDDWNSSRSWREEMTAQPWWEDRVVGAFSSYLIYQHLGNLAPRELEEFGVYRALREAGSDAERERILAEFAVRADGVPGSTQWSFHRDFGRVRVVLLDVRASRHLDPGDRRVMDHHEWDWTTRMCLEADVDHLVIGSSLPVFMIPALHHIEGWNEAVSSEASRGRITRRVGEWIRLAVDLEHWAAFRRSFDDMVGLLTDVAAGRGAGGAPATVLVLAGDVHCSYRETVRLTGAAAAGSPTRVHQLVMSPFRNPLESAIRVVNRVAVTRPAERLTRRLARAVGVRDPEVEWEVAEGVWFDNGVMTLVLDGRRADLEVEHAAVEWPGGEGAGSAPGARPRQVLRRTTTTRLSAD